MATTNQKWIVFLALKTILVWNHQSHVTAFSPSTMAPAPIRVTQGQRRAIRWEPNSYCGTLSSRFAETKNNRRGSRLCLDVSVLPNAKEEQEDIISNNTTNNNNNAEPSTAPLSARSPLKEKEEEWLEESKMIELVALGVWLTAISSFIFINNFIGPWPSFMAAVPERVWFVQHMVGGMLFGGGVILTTCFEWLVANNKNKQVLSFYFDKVPLLDAMIVLPALTMAMISGTGLAIERYGGLNLSPVHIKSVFWCLTGFATWWAVTDLATQGWALKDIYEWVSRDSSSSSNNNNGHHDEDDEVPKILEFRKLSNIVSCGFVFALYYIMVMKPGTLH